jgi:enterochelin esterase family protein
MNPEYIGLQSILTTHFALSGALLPVCFQLAAPAARSVSLIGEMTDWESAPIPMRRDQDGIWHTSLRLRQGQWLYKFIVDGAFVADPLNPLLADDGLGGQHSYLLLGNGDWSVRKAIAYGDIVRLEFDSVVLNGKTSLHVYLPPDYDQRRSYPVLYLLHGYRTKVNQWQSNGMIRNFMGNLLAQSLIEPFIIVMPDTCNQAGADSFNTFLGTELIEWLQRYFAVKAGRQATAVAGMSQYSLNAFRLAHEYPQRFGFAAPVSAFYSEQYLQQLARERLQLDLGLKLYCGAEDYVFERNERFAAILRSNGLRFDYMRVNGDHTWHYWNSITRDLLITVSEFFTGHRESMPQTIAAPAVSAAGPTVAESSVQPDQRDELLHAS